MKHFVTILLTTLFSTAAFSVNYSWVGAGSGGAGTDFNTAANWSPVGVPAAADNCQMTFTSGCTITLSANITINNLTMDGNVCASNLIRVMANTLTINGTATFRANNYCSPVSYNVLQLDAVNGNWIFNGTATFAPSGSGNVYMMANTAAPGDYIFRGSLVRFGQYAQTSPGTEPDFVFDRAGAMTINCRNTTYHVKGSSLTFGLSNSPTVTLTGIGATGLYRFQPYDGNLTIGANTIVSIRDTTVVNSSATLQCYTAAGGTFSMGANSILNYGSPNVWDGWYFEGLATNAGTGASPCYGTYSLNATSTVVFNARGWQDIPRNNYGHVILNGAGNAGLPDKYSRGTTQFTISGNLTVQNFAECIPRNPGGFIVLGNTLIETNAIFNATQNNAYPGITHTFRGNFTNNSVWTNGSTPGANLALFNGTANQTIGGTVSTNFYNLTCDKTSGTLFLGINTTVGIGTAGVASFLNGPMNLNARILTINNTATGAVTRTSGYAISENTGNLSKITWNMGAVLGARLFPFGSAGGVYIPFTFNPTAGTSNTVTVSTYPTVAANTPWPVTPQAVTNLNSTTGLLPDNQGATVDRFWQIDVSGTPTVTMTFSALTTELSTMLPAHAISANQRAQRYNTTVNRWEPALPGQSTGAIAGGFTVTVPGVTSFSPWALASNLSPLPIELTVFTGHPLNLHSNILAWETASETNNDFFVVERSADGIDFIPIGEVDGAGTSSLKNNYSFIDENAGSEINYYRLKQVDFDLEHEYSDVIAINKAAEGAAINIFPNPVSGTSNFFVTAGSESSGITGISILDVSGRIIYSESNLPKLNTWFFNHANLSGGLHPGVYFIEVKTGLNRTNKRIVIQE